MTRSGSYSASHQFSAFQSGLLVEWTYPRTVVRWAAGNGIWKSGIAGTSLAICLSARFSTRPCWTASRIRLAWSRSRVTSRWQ